MLLIICTDHDYWVLNKRAFTISALNQGLLSLTSMVKSSLYISPVSRQSSELLVGSHNKSQISAGAAMVS